jgi:Xaa-Pro aminopeptidase
MPAADVQCVCWTLSGPVSASPHGVGTNSAQLAGATIEAGHVLVNCVCPAIDGLFIENERTWFCGKPSQRQIQLFEVARAATEAGCAAAVAGNPIWTIDAAAQDVIERAGFGELICHRTGHGLGLSEHDFPIDTAFNDSALLERMLFSVEPGLYEYGLGGFRHDDTVLVGSEPEVLTTTPKDLAAQTIV